MANIVTGTTKLLEAYYDPAIDAVRFSAKFKGIPARGEMPIRDLRETIGEKFEPGAYVGEFLRAFHEGFIDLKPYRLESATPPAKADTPSVSRSQGRMR